MIGKRTLGLLVGLLFLYGAGRPLARLYYRATVLDPALAAALRDLDYARALAAIRRGADPNLRLPEGIHPFNGYVWETPLHVLTHWGTADDVRALLSRGAVVDRRDGADCTPLMLAVNRHDPRMTELLLAAGADPNAHGSGDWTPLMHLARGGSHWEPEPDPLQVETTRLLVRHGADVNAENEHHETALILAEVTHRTALAQELRRLGARKGLREALAGRPGAGLLHAVRMREMHEIKRLVANGESVDVTDWEGRTALMLAFEGYSGEAPILRYLLAHARGVPEALDRQDFHGRTALLRALRDLESFNDDAAVALLEAGADAAIQDENGMTADRELRIPGGLLSRRPGLEVGPPRGAAGAASRPAGQ